MVNRLLIKKSFFVLFVTIAFFSLCSFSAVYEDTYYKTIDGQIVYRATGARLRLCGYMDSMADVPWVDSNGIKHRGLYYTQVNANRTWPYKNNWSLDNYPGSPYGSDCSSSTGMAMKYALGVGKESFTCATLRQSAIANSNGVTLVGDYGAYVPAAQAGSGTIASNLKLEGNYSDGKTIYDHVYAEMYPGDAVVSDPHTMVVTQVNVVHDASGNVDPKLSYVLCTEQTGSSHTFKADGSKSSWGSPRTSGGKYTFEKLASSSKSFVPCAMRLCKETSKIENVVEEKNLKPVGGRIFYVKPSVDAGMYTFYDKDGNELDVDTEDYQQLGEAMYYTVSGKTTGYKYLVYATNNGAPNGGIAGSGVSKCWGPREYNAVGTKDGLFNGFYNFYAFKNKDSHYAYNSNIFYWVDTMWNSSEMMGCNDWYIPTKTEYTTLRNCGLVNLGSTKVWTSNEYGNAAYLWAGSEFDTWWKNTNSLPTWIIRAIGRDEPSMVKIKYYANGGLGEYNEQEVMKGSSVTLAACELEAQPGYHFVGWTTSADGSGTFYTNKQSVKVNNLPISNGELSLYAKWEKHDALKIDAIAPTSSEAGNCEYYKCEICGKCFSDSECITELDENAWIEALLIYDSNGHGTTPDSLVQSYSQETITSLPIMDGGESTFTEWNTEPDGTGITYKANEKIKDVNTIPTTIKLYAQWEEKEFLPVGGRIFYVNTAGDDNAVYTFYDKDKNKLDVDTENYNELGEAKYYTVSGKSTKLKYLVYATTNGEPNGSIANCGSARIWGPRIYNSIGAKSGLFNGFYNFNSFIGKDDHYNYNNGNNIFTVLDVNWNKTKKNGCSDWYIPTLSEMTTLYNCGLVSIGSTKVWTSEEYGEASWWTNISTNGHYWKSTNSFTSWIIRSIGSSSVILDIQYHNNDESIGNKRITQRASKGLYVKLCDNESFNIPDGHHLEWNTKEDYSGTSYLDKQKVAVNTLGGNKNEIDLYSDVVENTALLTYDSNGHGESPDAIEMNYSDETVINREMTDTGYTFIGWNTSSDGTGEDYVVGEVIKDAYEDPTAITLYAQWEENSYYLSYDTQGGIEVASSEAKYTLDANITDDIPIKEGFTFKEWNTEPSGNGLTISENAIWKKANSEVPIYTRLFAIYYTNVSKPTTPNDVTYDGKEKTVDIHAGAGVVEGGTTKATNAGTYTATYTLKDGYCWADGTRTPNTVAVNWTIAKATADRIEPEIKTDDIPYTGNEHSLLDISGSSDYGSYYFYIDTQNTYPEASSVSSTSCTALDLGTYYVWTKFVASDENYADGDVELLGSIQIIKGTPEIIIEPVAITNLVYNGNEIDLLCEMPVYNAGTVKYKLTNSVNSIIAPTSGYESIAPKALNSGTYRIWYYAVGDSKYNDSSKSYIDVTIDKANNTIVSPGDMTSVQTYSTSDATFELPQACPCAVGDVTYTKVSGSDRFKIDGNTLVMKANTSVNTYELTLKASAAGNENYKQGEVNFKYTIQVTKTEASVIEPTLNTDLTYNGSNQALITCGEDEHVKFYYYASSSNVSPAFEAEGWSETIPEEKNAGIYYVWYKAIGDLNYGDIPVTIVGTNGKVEIARKEITVKAEDKTSAHNKSIPEWSQVTTGLETGDSLGDISYIIKKGNDVISADSSTSLGEYYIIPEFSGNDNYQITYINGIWTVFDAEEPVVSISNVTHGAKAEQTIKLNATDDIGITKYYFGTSSNAVPSNDTLADITALNGNGLNKEIKIADTYYLIACDAAGHISKANITFYETNLEVMHGSIIDNATKILTASGDSFSIPEIIADEGFAVSNGNVWIVGEELEPTITDKGVYSPIDSLTLKATCKDNEPPTAEISASSNVTDYQTVELRGTDNVGITKYYFGASENGIPDKDWGESNIENVTSAGTYYLITKDKDGNISEPCATTFYKISFIIERGKVNPTSVLMLSGKTFKLPKIIPSAGNSLPAENVWKVGNTETYFNDESDFTANGNVTLFANCEEILYPVGGRIYYVNKSVNSGTYTFYDYNKNLIELTEEQKNNASYLTNAAYYSVTGFSENSPKDKYYVYALNNPANDRTTPSKKDTYAFAPDLLILPSDNSNGEYNTTCLLQSKTNRADTNNAPGYILGLRKNGLNGCNDWFIPSRDEINTARSSQIGWFSSNPNKFWSSTRVNNYIRAMTDGSWGAKNAWSNTKYRTVIPIRKFGLPANRVEYKLGTQNLGEEYYDYGSKISISHYLTDGYDIESWWLDEECNTKPWNLEEDTLSTVGKTLTLYGSGNPYSLELEEETYTASYLASNQNIQLKNPSGGTGYYTYTIIEKPTDVNFTVSNTKTTSITGDKYINNLLVPASTPAGDYEIKVKVTDKYSGSTGEGIINVKVNPAQGNINLKNGDTTYADTDTISLQYLEPLTLEIATTSGDISARIKDVELVSGVESAEPQILKGEDIADIEVDDNTIIVNPKALPDDIVTELIITADATQNYSAITKSYTLSIERREIDVIVTGFTNLPYDGESHGLMMEATEVEGSDVYYTVVDGSADANYFGDSEIDYNLGPVRLEESNKEYVLDDESAILSGPGTKTIFYKIISNNDGYHDIIGSSVLNMKKKTLTVVAEDKTTCYGDNVPEWTVNIDGLVKEDLIGTVHYTVLSNGEIITPSSQMPLGTYTIVPSADVNDKYDYVFENGTWIVNKADNPIVSPGDFTWNQVYTTSEATFELPETCPSAEGEVTYSMITENENFSINGHQLVMEPNTPADTYELTIKANVQETEQYETGEVNFKVKVIVAKIDADITEPTQKTNLTYNNEFRDLITAGTTSHGEFYYYVSSDSQKPETDAAGWSKTIPTQKNAGTYYLWYKLEGDSNHNDISVTKVGLDGKVEIAKKSVSIKAEDKTSTYNTTIPTWSYIVTGLLAGDSLGTISYTIKDAGNEIQAKKTTDVGEYTIIPCFTGNGNYQIEYINGIWTIFKAENVISAESSQIFTSGESNKKVIATALGEASLSYRVKSGSSVDVDEMTGELTINCTGDSIIIISSEATHNYKESTKEIIVKILDENTPVLPIDNPEASGEAETGSGGDTEKPSHSESSNDEESKDEESVSDDANEKKDTVVRVKDKQIIFVRNIKVIGKKTIKISWNLRDDASKYVVFGSTNGKNFKKITELKGNSYIIKKISGKKLKKNKPYSFRVVAYKANGKILYNNKYTVITGNTSGKYANVKSMKAKNIQIKSGARKKINVKYKMYSKKKHLPIKYGKTIYISSNPKVAKVNASGVVKAVGTGTAVVFIQDICGKYCKAKITVK